MIVFLSVASLTISKGVRLKVYRIHNILRVSSSSEASEPQSKRQRNSDTVEFKEPEIPSLNSDDVPCGKERPI